MESASSRDTPSKPCLNVLRTSTRVFPGVGSIDMYRIKLPTTLHGIESHVLWHIVRITAIIEFLTKCIGRLESERNGCQLSASHEAIEYNRRRRHYEFARTKNCEKVVSAESRTNGKSCLWRSCLTKLTT